MGQFMQLIAVLFGIVRSVKSLIVCKFIAYNMKFVFVQLFVASCLVGLELAFGNFILIAFIF